MVTSVFKNLVFKTSCESIEIHHWSIPHCGQPQQFNIQHSKSQNCAQRLRVLKIYSCYPRYSCSKISCSPCERLAANKDPWDRCDPCAKKYSCHSRNSCSKKFMVTSVFKNLVFKTSCESIEIHDWSIPHCGQPQQFNIQKSKLRSAPPCAKNIRVIRVITSLRSVGLRRISCSKEYTKGYALNWVLTKYILNDIEKIKERIGRIKKKI